jgi:hypothetical protein
MEIALEVLGRSLPDVLNHNMETVPRLYRQARPGADYAHSLAFMKGFKARYPQIPTKSGLMVGLGETDDEIIEVLRDLRANDVEMLTIGQYLAPSSHHLPVARYVHPETFQDVRAAGTGDGLYRRRLRADGAFELLGGRAGRKRWRRLSTGASCLRRCARALPRPQSAAISCSARSASGSGLWPSP